jgi:ribulose-5-phosphate 4-epimerase/fuculose-1-phosphate aldolase
MRSCKSRTHGAIGLGLLVAALSWGAAWARSQPGPAADSDGQRIEDLVIACHICANEGVMDSFGHLSVRSTKNPERFFMSRALAPAQVTAADIMEFDMSGNPVDPQGRRANGERFIHSEIYRARPDVQGVIHSHSPVVMPFGIAGVPLKPVIAQAGFLPLDTPLFEIRDAWGTAEERGMLVRNSTLAAALARKLGKSPVVLMRGHGHCVVADSIRRATIRAVYTEMNARVLQSALQLSKNITPLDEKEIAYNPTENFDLERPWDNLKSRLPDASRRE